jgi:nucleotide-binding universal stress UspA family protein
MGIFERILVPIDGSPPSEAGVALATTLAKEHGASLIFVNIVDIAALTSTADYAAIDTGAIADDVEDFGHELAEKAAATARASGITASGRVIDGPVVDGLLDAVTASEATLIVIGSHGHTGLARVFLGSVTEHLLRHATVPVLVVPHVTAAAEVRAARS